MAAKQEKHTDDPASRSSIDEADAATDERKVCGIVMPIAAMGDEYPEAHWGRVRRVLQRAIDRAGLRSQLVWENPEVDVIQTAILQNLYENDVVVCDVSNLNPNVMLETGLRLSTKRPTVIVTDRVMRPPFDISTIAYIDYPRDLEYNATEDFIGKLARKIAEVAKAASEDRYHSYIEQFRFETVEPAKVTVTTDEYLRERLDDLAASVRRLSRNQERPQGIGRAVSNRERADRPMPVDMIDGEMDRTRAADAEQQIDMLPGMLSTVRNVEGNKWQFTILAHDPENARTLDGIQRARDIIKRAERDTFFDPK